MIIKIMALCFLITSSVFAGELDGVSEINEASNYNQNKNFLDIIIDDTHAYTYLSCKNGMGLPYSVYSSLMPKDEDAGQEGIEEFPKILELLLEVGDCVSEQTIGSDLYSRLKNGESQLGFTFKEVLDAFKFGFCYMIADYLELAVEGEITDNQPAPNKIKLRKRFYLTPNEAKRAIALINRSFRESLEGKVIYDSLKHNCIDYAKEIYEGIGLHRSQGEFLSQLGLDPASDNDLDDHEDGIDSMLLKAYKIHNDGDIGFRQVMLVVWNTVRIFLGI